MEKDIFSGDDIFHGLNRLVRRCFLEMILKWRRHICEVEFFVLRRHRDLKAGWASGQD